jgi:hypothetical protein
MLGYSIVRALRRVTLSPAAWPVIDRLEQGRGTLADMQLAERIAEAAKLFDARTRAEIFAVIK